MPETTLQPEPIILAVDTTAPQASYALYAGARELACRVTTADAPHSHTFFGEIESLLRDAAVTINDLQAIAAVTGPGSFTGLRVALAAVQGFAQTLRIPAWGLTTLDATALAAGVAGRVLIIIEAGRGECFVGLRNLTAQGGFTQPVADAAGPLETILPEFLPTLAGELFVTGNGVASHQTWLNEWAVAQGLTLHFDAANEPQPLAPVIAAFVARAIQDGVAAERHPLQACYIRPPDAKLKAAS